MVRSIVVVVQVAFYEVSRRICYGEIDGGVASRVTH